MLVNDFPTPPPYEPSPSYGPIFLTLVNGRLLFWNSVPSESGLWTTDGTTEGTHILHSFAPFPISLTKVDETLFFLGDDGVHREEIWKSDGTVAGTVLVKDAAPGSSSPFDVIFPTMMTASSGGKYFVMAWAPVLEFELWVSDGTDSGTHLVKDIYPGSGDSLPHDLTDVDGTLFFFADDNGHGSELWKSDGTEAGTVLVKDINPGMASGVGFYPMKSLNHVAYFLADDGVHGAELWRSDGTAEGTILVKDIQLGPGGSFPMLLASLDGILYFSADDGVHGRALWKTDGTPSGTVLVKAVEPGMDMIDAGGFLVFSASDGVHGQEVWVSDGTPAGTVRLADISPGASSFSPSLFTRSGPFVFLSGDDGKTGRELWAFRVAGVDRVTPPAHGPRQIPFRSGR